MKNIDNFIKESLVNEAGSPTLRLLEKVGKIIDNESKLKKYITDNKDELTGVDLGSSDIQDVKEIMQAFHAAMLSMAEEGEEGNIAMYIEDAPEILADDYDENWTTPAVELYKKLYKEITNQDLI